MNRKALIILLAGLFGFAVSCEKDETKIFLSEDPVLPVITTFPDLVLEEVHKADTIIFKATPVDPGFTASATYFLEACISGNEFTSAGTVRIYNGVQDTLMKVTEEAVNKLFKGKKYEVGVATATDFRIRVVMKLDAGTGSLGSSDNPLVYLSETSTRNVTVY